jgi:hypothetical protein
VEGHANGRPSLKATVTQLNVAGPHVRLQVATEYGDRIDVDIPHDRFQQLSIYVGATVFLVPREMKLFVAGSDSYAAAQAEREYREREARNLSPAGP